MTTDMPEGQPEARAEARWVEACALPTAAQPLRVAEFDALFATAVRSVNRVSATRLRLALDAAHEARARELAVRETECCSFFTFDFTDGGPGTVWLSIEVPESHIDILTALSARAAATGTG